MIIGAAFGTVVAALVKDLITPVIAAAVGKPDFGRLRFTLNSSTFLYGDLVNAVISFVLVAAAVYFLVVVPVNRLMALHKTEPEVLAPTKECPDCLSAIPSGARRCAFCTVEQPQAPVP